MDSSRFLIIANGPPMPKERVHELIQKMGKGSLVALDGAVNVLLDSQDHGGGLIIPDVILGDFDSVQMENASYPDQPMLASLKKYFSEKFQSPVEIEYQLDQNKTDLQKGIEYCDKMGATSIFIIHALGTDRMDHSLANLNLLKAYHSPGRALHLLTESQVIRYLDNEEITFTGKIGEAVGIFGFPRACVNSQGLIYPLVNYEVQLGVSFSSSNCIGPLNASGEGQVTLRVDGQAIVTYPN